MNFTTFLNEPINPGTLVRCTHHGSAWPHVVTSTGRSLEARPMARCGLHWEPARHIRPEDVWYAISKTEARDLDLPGVSS